MAVAAQPGRSVSLRDSHKEPYWDFSHFGRDFISSLVVFLVALPLCMGIAIASGVPPALGLATGIIGGIVVGTFSGAPLLVSGPAAGLSVIVFEIVNKFGIERIGPILLVAGVLQFIAGRLKLGVWFRAISPAVVYGMLSGIGVLIIGAQFHVMLDDQPKASGIANLLAIPGALIKGVFPPDGTSHHIAAGLGLLTLICVLTWNRLRPAQLKALPGTLVGVVIATAVASLNLPVKKVTLPENLLGSFSLFNGGTLSGVWESSVLLASLTIAVVASAETLLAAVAVDKMHSGRPANFNKELSAQGAGNMLCGLIGALPMTGVIVRSSANVQAGARTRLSAVMHGIWLLALVLLFPSVLRMIPTASLAAILIFTGFKLIEIQHVRNLAEYGRMPVVIYAATVAGIVTTDLLTGVMVGVALSLVKLIYKATRFRVEVEHHPEERRVDVHLHGAATFLGVPRLATALESIPGHMVIHLHAENLYHIDHTCLDLLRSLSKQHVEKGGGLEVEWGTLTKRFHLTEINR